MVLPISSMLSMSSMGSVSSIFAMYAAVSAFINLIQNTLSNLLPYQIQNYIVSLIRRYFVSISTTTTLVIEARDGMSTNEVFAAAEVYLCSKIRRGNPNAARLKISKRSKETNLSITFAQCEKILDSFDGIELQWRFFNEEGKTKSKSREIYDLETRNIVCDSDERHFELCFDKRFKDKVLDSYIPYLLESANVIRAEKKVVKLHTLSVGSSFAWDSISLEHPSTFETLAMMPGQKQSLIEDLDRFVRRKDFYRRVGRAWKRGYLLHGPPGTGKSSLIAAMANYLKFDIYDLDLTNVRCDSDLRSLLLRTANRSILVVEDIDCTVELPDRKMSTYEFDSLDGPIHHRPQQFTLAGLLNFIDGLWSSCGDERIIVFTTNNKRKLEPALLRPGRMDRHIHMSYLTPDGFRLLASTYLNVQEPHPHFAEIEELIAKEKVTPAEIAEELMQSDDVDVCLDAVVEFLKNSKDVRERREIDDERENDAVCDERE